MVRGDAGSVVIRSHDGAKVGCNWLCQKLWNQFACPRDAGCVCVWVLVNLQGAEREAGSDLRELHLETTGCTTFGMYGDAATNAKNVNFYAKNNST